jgi:GNAT superfamily N-acetyltransferase
MENVNLLPIHHAALDTTAVVRPAEYWELPELSALVTDALETYRGNVPDALLDLYIERSRNFTTRWEQGEVLVAADGERLLGTVTFYRDASHSGFPSTWAGFGTLAVHPSLRQRGTGTLLVRHCIARAEAVAPTVAIHTGTFMRRARRIYESHGFVRLPAYDLHASSVIVLQPGTDDVQMLAYRLDLDGDALSG